MSRRRGFTIVELLMAMSFIAILLVAITVLVIDLQGIYRRGLAMREVNSTARSVVDDITRAITSAPATTGGAHAVEFSSSGRVEGGVFCTGFYSYIWKQADFLGGGLVRVDGARDYRLLKVRDVGRKLCDRGRMQGLGLSCNNESKLVCNLNSQPNLTSSAFGLSEKVEMISSAGLELALFDFDIFRPASSNLSGQVFYAGSFILGTPRGANDQGGIVSSEVCTPPAEFADAEFDFQYCSINKFNFAASSLGAIGEG